MLVKMNSILTNRNISDASSSLDTNAIKEILNKIFPNAVCNDVLYTLNNDNMFFGVVVNPALSDNDMMNILFNDDPRTITKYSVEIDSKLFDIGLSAEEISSYIIYEVSAMVSYISPVSELRAIIDNYLSNEDDYIAIKDSVKYISLIIFAMKDALRKIASSIYKEDTDEILSDSVINSLEIKDYLMSALIKVRSSIFGIGSTVKEPNLVLIKWAFDMYKDMKHNKRSVIETLSEALISTGSYLIKSDIKRTINKLQRVEDELEITAEQVIREAKSGGLFTNLKRNGLRAIEDDLYEFTIRVKNADTEEDAYYALRQINTRINLLEEYIATTALSEAEEKHWRDVAIKFRELRTVLSNKKIVDRKSYGLFFNYDELDNM